MSTVMDRKTKPAVDTLRINGERLWDSLMELAKIGATPKGGVCRLTLTDLDRQGRDLVLKWAREAGMTVTIDKIGNGFMRRAGRNNALPPIVTGSHIDTQPTGGKFDGNYGVLAGHRGGAHAERPRHRDRGAHRGGVLDQRGRLALRPGDDGLGRVRQGLHARARLRGDGHGRQDGEGRARAHRLPRHRRARRASHRLLLRDPHRAGPGARGQRQDHRRRDRRAGRALVRLRGHRHGSPRRPHADGAAQGRAAGRDAGSCRRWWPAPTAIRRMAAAPWAWSRCFPTAAT